MDDRMSHNQGTIALPILSVRVNRRIRSMIMITGLEDGLLKQIVTSQPGVYAELYWNKDPK
jgi:hypothetical protein